MLVVGAGTMGSGIAQVVAEAQILTIIFDADPSGLERGLASIATRWDRLAASGRRTASETAAYATYLSAGTLADAQSADLIIEAIVEKRQPKASLFAELEGAAPPSTLFASNTSSISISALGEASGRPDRFVGMHFFNPVPVLPLVEIVRGLETSDQSVETAATFAAAIGKTPVIVRDAPGFVANRILIPMINEAIFTLQDGVAPREAIDDVMKLGMSHPMGPLALADLIGLDICLDILETLHHDFGEDKYRPAPLLRRMVGAGKLGRKSGHGFYDY
ncbi:MAG TPA: 3-hydroxyacyl-CoA dehydrogenase NAD-binding domain-containing protein [Thermomicrobiales bacterium]|nr:3-hydroxyacyl-CoA dehydrogenase NAD-binding domain-containing protein [Thermomicrobiales bacterium]